MNNGERIQTSTSFLGFFGEGDDGVRGLKAELGT
jgi:hypothetical protein